MHQYNLQVTNIKVRTVTKIKFYLTFLETNNYTKHYKLTTNYSFKFTFNSLPTD